jgi:mRNA interferase RelE/StbE
VPDYAVSLRRSAAKYLERCDKITRDRLLKKLDGLKADPFAESKPLKGRSDERSARVGDLRILFRVDEAEIIIAEIGPRGQIYKHSR